VIIFGVVKIIIFLIILLCSATCKFDQKCYAIQICGTMEYSEYLTSAILNKIINWKQYCIARFLSDYVTQFVIRMLMLCILIPVL